MSASRQAGRFAGQRQLSIRKHRRNDIAIEVTRWIVTRLHNHWRRGLDRQAVPAFTLRTRQFTDGSRFGLCGHRSVFATAGLGGAGTVHRSRPGQRQNRRDSHQLRTEQAQRPVSTDATRSHTTSEHRQKHQPPRHDAARQLLNTRHHFILSRQFIPTSWMWDTRKGYASRLPKAGKMSPQSNFFASDGWRLGH